MSLTSIHCPLFCTMSTTQGSDLLSVSRSRRPLHETRSSTLVTHVAGPLRLVAGEVASWTSFIMTQGERRAANPAERRGEKLLVLLRGVGKRKGSAAGGLKVGTRHAHRRRTLLTLHRCHTKREILVECQGTRWDSGCYNCPSELLSCEKSALTSGKHETWRSQAFTSLAQIPAKTHLNNLNRVLLFFLDCSSF